MNTFNGTDPYGRNVFPLRREILSVHRQRRLAKSAKTGMTKPSNGLYDPWCFFHILDAVLHIEPDTRFTAAELTTWLEVNRPQYRWDSRTVGRILNDIIESLNDASPREAPAFRIVTWGNIRHYIVTPFELTDKYLIDTLLEFEAIAMSDRPDFQHAALARVNRSPLLLVNWLNP